MEPQPIGQILKNLNPEERPRQEVLDSLQHIELTPEEEIDGLIWAKQRKERMLNEAAVREREKENRELLTSKEWDFKQTGDFALWRAHNIFGKDAQGNYKFQLDPINKIFFQLLCFYFSKDPDFEKFGTQLGFINPSLKKGLLIRGVVGTGKTWMMQTFAANQRMPYKIFHAKKVADSYSAKEEENRIYDYVKTIPNPSNDKSTFFKPFSGLCIDDIGTEEIRNDYGNKRNVIGDIIELRYSEGNCGELFHATTNLDYKALEEKYGMRALDRMNEIWNFIDLPGTSRRK